MYEYGSSWRHLSSTPQLELGRLTDSPKTTMEDGSGARITGEHARPGPACGLKTPNGRLGAAPQLVNLEKKKNYFVCKYFQPQPNCHVWSNGKQCFAAGSFHSGDFALRRPRETCATLRSGTIPDGYMYWRQLVQRLAGSFSDQLSSLGHS